MNKKALIIGSIAYDKIFSITGSIRDKLLVQDGVVKKIDMTFRAEEPVIRYGGIAGNISYGLASLDETPILVGLVGGDFKIDYQKHLESKGVNIKVYVKDDSITAAFYGIDDSEHQTISIWQPNASTHLELLSLKKQLNNINPEEIGIINVAPVGMPFSLTKFILEARYLYGDKPKIIFDPGQDLAYMEKQNLIDCLENSNILIVNDTELAQFTNIFGFELADIFKFGIEYIIETQGEEGSTIHTSSKNNIKISVTPPNQVIQVTGAGDAFRSGLIYGLSNNKDIETAAKYGSVMGSFAVEQYGGQGYKISINDFNKRYNFYFK